MFAGCEHQHAGSVRYPGGGERCSRWRLRSGWPSWSSRGRNCAQFSARGSLAVGIGFLRCGEMLSGLGESLSLPPESFSPMEVWLQKSARHSHWRNCCRSSENCVATGAADERKWRSRLRRLLVNRCERRESQPGFEESCNLVKVGTLSHNCLSGISPVFSRVERSGWGVMDPIERAFQKRFCI